MLFDDVGTPADDTGHGEERCEKLFRQAEHLVDEAGVEVDVRAGTLVHVPLGRDDLRCEFRHFPVQFVLFGAAFFRREHLGEALEDLRTGVGLRVDRVADAVDESALVEDFLVQEFLQVGGDFVVVLPIVDVLLEVFVLLLVEARGISVQFL